MKILLNVTMFVKLKITCILSLNFVIMIYVHISRTIIENYHNLKEKD
jgi:hypothetical protein